MRGKHKKARLAGASRREDAGALRTLARAIRCSRGSAAVEFAMIAPFLFLLIYGTIELSRFMYIRHSLQFAVDEAARFAMVRPGVTSSQVKNFATNRVESSYAYEAQFGISRDVSGGVNFIRIDANYDYTSLIHIANLGSFTVNVYSRVPQL